MIATAPLWRPPRLWLPDWLAFGGIQRDPANGQKKRNGTTGKLIRTAADGEPCCCCAGAQCSCCGFTPGSYRIVISGTSAGCVDVAGTSSINFPFSVDGTYTVNQIVGPSVPPPDYPDCTNDVVENDGQFFYGWPHDDPDSCIWGALLTFASPATAYFGIGCLGSPFGTFHSAWIQLTTCGGSCIVEINACSDNPDSPGFGDSPFLSVWTGQFSGEFDCGGIIIVPSVDLYMLGGSATVTPCNLF